MLLGHSWWPKVKCWSVTPLVVWGHPRSPTVFLPIAWDWEELETWKRSQYICLVNTLRLICNLGHAVTLTWGQIFKTWPFKVMLYMLRFRSVLTRQARWCRNNCSIISNTYVVVEKTVSLKNDAVFDLSWPLTLKRLILCEIWRHLSERAFQDLSLPF